ncbi:MAG: MerR family DNA-binding transcriptional regulator [Planctomycetes bacterium]|nr:MerR family DNA-binding transcriptional regulator [Planctomycetota bacterium]
MQNTKCKVRHPLGYSAANTLGVVGAGHLSTAGKSPGSPGGCRGAGQMAEHERRPLHKIGELIERSGISRQTLHNYTMLGLIESVRRTPSGHRLYDDLALARLDRIKELRATKTLLEIKELLAAEVKRGAER